MNLRDAIRIMPSELNDWTRLKKLIPSVPAFQTSSHGCFISNRVIKASFHALHHICFQIDIKYMTSRRIFAVKCYLKCKIQKWIFKSILGGNSKPLSTSDSFSYRTFPWHRNFGHHNTDITFVFQISFVDCLVRIGSFEFQHVCLRVRKCYFNTFAVAVALLAGNISEAWQRRGRN